MPSTNAERQEISRETESKRWKFVQKKTFIVKWGKEQPKITNLAHTRQP